MPQFEVDKEHKDKKGRVTGVELGPGTPDDTQQLADAVQEIQAHLEATGGFTPAHKIDASKFGLSRSLSPPGKK